MRMRMIWSHTQHTYCAPPRPPPFPPPCAPALQWRASHAATTGAVTSAGLHSSSSSRQGDTQYPLTTPSPSHMPSYSLPPLAPSRELERATPALSGKLGGAHASTGTGGTGGSGPAVQQQQQQRAANSLPAVSLPTAIALYGVLNPGAPDLQVGGWVRA